MSASTIQVAIKVRPIEPKQASKWEVAGNSIKLIDGQPEPSYFDHIFDQDSTNQVIFDTIAKQIVAAGVKGFNGTIFAYGQTSSGKTYTMMGDEKNPGVMVLAAKKIFNEIENASDWQFLLRVSYIEIYNEKIYDLLCKSNQDLKIHETLNGEVVVNCSENIITCEQDLLMYLREGSKIRKIGETNMNERSSRSHAIFRIIIESRKMDKSDDDSVQISILNLVDLAGSERADQTGATGSRLKEGGHINKSLLFLSRVIKQLAEGKYVSYRDSKLTRILQASLGGNALTAIICTINPTAVEETLSTLSFANRAKVVKNKPQVNEVVTDGAMMKRLYKKIDRLTAELEVEKTKNSQIKVSQLQKLLNEETHKIINSNSVGLLKASSKNRRRTWCPSSMIPPLAEESPSPKTEPNIPQMTLTSQMPSKLQLPKSSFNFTPHITVRDVYYQNECQTPNIDEEFVPGEIACFDEISTPQTSPHKLGFKTPTNKDFLLRTSLTPKLTEKESLQKVERELKELETFTNLENKLNVDHDTYNTLKFKLENAESLIASYEKEREDFAFIKVEHLEAQTNLSNCQMRCQELESKVNELEKSSQNSADLVTRYEKEITELKEKIFKTEMENRAAVGLEFEFEQHKNKSKRRENELLEALEEKRKEINKLERSLQKLSTDMLNNSKEELQQISRNTNDSESTCNKCKDFNRILTGKQQLLEDYEKITSDNHNLHLNIEKISAEAESVKLKVDSLETENNRLKKDIDHFTSLHGTIEEVQNRIVSLQSEKCKLESIKIQFEVMSKETACKIADKIKLSQEIEILNAQRQTLETECDRLLSDIASNGCVKEELEKLRHENDSLHSELQKIKTKLEIVELEYNNLITENQSKSDNFEKLNMEVATARDQLQTLQNEYRDIQQKYEQIQAECNKHEGTIGEIQSEYESIQNKYQSLQKEYEKLENDSVQSFADCDRVQTQNENLETEIRELKIKVEEAQRKLLENDSLQVELNSLKSEMNRLQGEYDKNLCLVKEPTSPSYEKTINELRQENSKLKEELDSLQKSFNEMQNEYDDMSTQLVDNFSDYETLQNEMKNLQADFERYQKQHLLAKDLEALKENNKKLESEKSHLLKENSEWKTTIASMTKSIEENCDEREQLVAHLEEIKKNSPRSESPNKTIENCIQFIQLAESFLEIEISLGDGNTRIFQSKDVHKSASGTRMIVGNISNITKGTFNQLRGAIEFAISSDVHKFGNDIYDSLEMEKTTSSPNSCDSLEVPCRQPNEAQINELTEEKSKLFENVRQLQETVAILKAENFKLEHTRRDLDNTQLAIDQLKCEKDDLSEACEKHKCKIIELNEIILRSEYDNKKLIADCEELKKTVESDCALESVSRETYEELKKQHEEMCEKMLINDKAVAEYNNTCAELKQEILALRIKCENEITTPASLKIEKIDESEKNGSIDMVEVEKNGNCKNDEDYNQENTFNCSQQKEKLQQTELSDENKVKHDDDAISKLTEQLKQEESNSLKLNEQTKELRMALEEKTKESVENSAKIKELNKSYEKLKSEYDELLSFERMKSTELEETVLSLNRLETECSLLQKSVASLKETVTSLEDERNNVLQSSEVLLENNKKLNETLNMIQHQNNVDTDNLKTVLEKSLKLEQDKTEILAQCNSLKNSERNLQELLEKLKQDYEIIVKDKNNLSNENHKLSLELEKLKEGNEKGNQDLQENCNKLNDDLIALTNEKEKLSSEFELLKIQQAKYLEEKTLLEEKCVGFKKEINELISNANELQSALEKEKKHSESILQEAKSAEEQLNLEISLARNSNSAMSEQIEMLNEKLEKDEFNSKVALNKAVSEKDELTTKLTNLDARSSELTEKCKLLEQQLEESKQCLATEMALKQEKEKDNVKKDVLLEELSKSNNLLNTQTSELQDKCSLLEKNLAELEQCVSSHLIQIADLQNKCSDKEEMISQLSSKNQTLTTKASELEENLNSLQKQFEESKRSLLDDVQSIKQDCINKDEHIEQLTNKNNNLVSKISELEEKFELIEQQFEDSKQRLANEVHLNKVLEKANTERDDLIVQLTNNNNSLVTKTAELEEKLAILGNQHDESERHLTGEVSRLNKLLTETKQASSSQSSRIEDLISKIKYLESDLKKAQNESSERDSLLKKIDQLQTEYDSLTEKHAGLELTRLSFEAELNSARAVVVENTSLVSSLQSSLQEIQMKCDSLSSSKAELEIKNKELSKQIQNVTQQAAECIRLKSDILCLQEELKKSKVHLTKLESKESSFGNQIAELEAYVNRLISEKATIQSVLESTDKKYLEKIAHLEEQIHLLSKEKSISLSTSISPKREKGMEHMMSENHQLKVKNMSLMDKLNSCQKSSPNEERKNRRLSTHDERRMQSFWDSNRDVSTMTDPANADCSCSEMDKKLNEMKQRLLIRDSQVNTLSMELKNHPLKTENASLKKLIIEEESKQQQLRQEIKKYKNLIVNRTNESRHCGKCAEIAKKIFVDSFAQTADSDESECYRKLLTKYEDLKMICRVRHVKIRELEDALSKGKENANNDNISSLNNQQYKIKYDQVQKELKVVQEKYEQAKILCNTRYEQIQKLYNQQPGNS